MISPEQAFLNPNPWDINMIAEDVFVQNDYGFISQQSFIGLTNAEIKSASIKKNIAGDNTPNVFDFYNKEVGNYHLSSDILGPSSAKNKYQGKGFCGWIVFQIADSKYSGER